WLHRLRLHPNPRLCPYTTLFRAGRSIDHPRAVGTAGRGRRPSVRLLLQGEEIIDMEVLQGALFHTQPFLLPVPEKLVHSFHLSVDRKSTRLNSSHVKISYAVFCL